MNIKVKYLTEGLTPLKVTDKGDWIDLRCAETTEIQSYFTSLGNKERIKSLQSTLDFEKSSFRRLMDSSIKDHGSIEPTIARQLDTHNGRIKTLEEEIKAIPKAGVTLIPLGVAMELPKDYEALISARSSTFKNYGIIQTNPVGIVDNSYCGDTDQWFFACIALRDTVIPKDERICQFRIQKKQSDISFNTVKTLGNKDRGGHGSTGKK